MEPKDFARVILRRKGTVLTALVVVMVFSFWATLRKSPQYVAQCEIHFGAILADPTNPESEPIESLGSLHSNLQYLKSGALAIKAAKLLKGASVLPADQVLGRIGELKLVTVDGAPTQDFSIKIADSAPSKLPSGVHPGQRAADVCNAVADAYVAYKEQYALGFFNRALKANESNYAQTDQRIQQVLRKLAGVNLALARGDGTVNELAELELERINLKVQSDTLLNTRVDYQQKIEAFRNQIVNGVEGGPQVSNRAGPGVPVGADHKRDIFLGLLIGLLFGVAVAVLREYFDDTVRDKESTQRELGVPVLANIPDGDGVDGFDGISPQTLESARTLRATLASLGVPHEKSVLLITSSLAKSRSATLISLAGAFAESGRSVLVLGSDLRSGRTHEGFGIANTVGLANVVRGQVAFEKAIRPAPGLEGVYVMPCGPIIGNPGELLSSEEMAMVLRRARRWADVVLLDAPPVLAAADSSILGAYADGVVLVVSAGRTNRHQALEAKEQLVAAGARVLGAVLVGTEESAVQGDGDYGAEIPSMVSYWGGGSYDAGDYSDWYTDDALTTSARMTPRQRGARREPAKKISASSTRVKLTGDEPAVRVPRNGVRRDGARGKSARSSGARKPAAGKGRRSPSPALLEQPRARSRGGVPARKAPRPTPISRRRAFER